MHFAAARYTNCRSFDENTLCLGTPAELRARINEFMDVFDGCVNLNQQDAFDEYFKIKGHNVYLK